MSFDRYYALCIQKLYHTHNYTVGGCWNKSLHLQPLQRRYCENSGGPASARVVRRYYCITYTQSLYAIIGSIAVGLVRNLVCGRPSYKISPEMFYFPDRRQLPSTSSLHDGCHVIRNEPGIIERARLTMLSCCEGCIDTNVVTISISCDRNYGRYVI